MYPSRYELLEKLNADHHKSMLEQAFTERMLRESRSVHPGRFERSMIRLADWLITMGERVRRRYESPGTAPETSLRTEVP